MNDSDLERKLKSAHAPERTEEYWGDFPRQVMAQLRANPELRPHRAQWKPKLAWGIGIAFACLMIGFAVGHWRGRTESDSFALLQNEKMLREVLTMFPNRIRAIEQDEHGVRLVLSDDADVPASTPLWIKICDGKNCRAVVTFSGQNLQIAKEQVEVLMDAQGKVILVGNNFVWSSGESTRVADGLRIQARPLNDVM
jgi:hypothetical protein